jgi:hypothetical protein
MDDRAEVYGSQGVAYADLLRGNSIETFSAVGYDYAVEKAGSTVGWSFTMYEEAWNYGFPQEMAHFVDCVRHDTPPLVTGEDGRAVLEAIFAAYESARNRAEGAPPVQHRRGPARGFVAPRCRLVLTSIGMELCSTCFTYDVVEERSRSHRFARERTYRVEG